MMLGLRRDHGTTLVLVTHDPALAQLSDRVVRLRDGRIVESLDHARAAASTAAEVAR
jgi:predicted ABC-type transport system involved in lysophospholipase L1 biosynthesis ATPase subunit